MKVLVTGGCGQLGMCLRSVILSGAKNLEAVFTDVIDAPDTVHLDITDLSAVKSLVEKEKVDVIINCAAYTNVEAAEDNYDLAELLNAKAVENLAVAMRDVDGLLVHISTDYVFGKEPYNTPCKEDQKGTPTGVYGLTKLHGEQAILHSGVRHIIIRTAWLYSEYGKNFLKTMLDLTANRPSLKVVFDQVGTPTYAGDLARAILEIADQVGNDVMPGPDRASQIYNYSNEGVCSWYDFARMIAQLSGHTSCDIQPCHSGEFPSKVVRPAYSVLDKTKIKETFGLEIPDWTDSLKACISKIL
ncbi:MAG: dTDP-4-dehydrorhamnose reductase [Bacteroidales bacterium]|nr:dTDP-4-dehydrorhamnose reductase [Bacteroidales bacterium]